MTDDKTRTSNPAELGASSGGDRARDAAGGRVAATALDFAELERRYSKAADDLIGGCIDALSDVDTETLLGIAAYNEAIRPGGWMQSVIREYVETWR